MMDNEKELICEQLE